MSKIIKMNPHVRPGGVYVPTDCIPRSKVAIIIPFRNRTSHLETLLYHLHPLLQRQQICYSIYVIEQYGEDIFNKGVLMNAGALESMIQHPDVECFIFHDVDLIPEDDRNLYNCPIESPRHMSHLVDKYQYKLPYKTLVGGVLAISKAHFQLINGYSNVYFGWGAEDDDMAKRIIAKNLHIERPRMGVGRYHMIKHDPREKSPKKIRKFLKSKAMKRQHQDGLSSVRYEIIAWDTFPLYIRILIEIDPVHKKERDTFLH